MIHHQCRNMSDGVLLLTGELDRTTVPSLHAAFLLWKPDQEKIEIRLNEVKRIDSAGMALLIHIIEHAKKQNCHIMLGFLPAQLITLLRLSNAESLLREHIKT